MNDFKKSVKEANEGRTYIWCCGSDKNNICVRSGEKLSICHECNSTECRKWYKLGKLDERRRLKKKYLMFEMI
jgi:hypothetical protein